MGQSVCAYRLAGPFLLKLCQHQSSQGSIKAGGADRDTEPTKEAGKGLTDSHLQHHWDQGEKGRGGGMNESLNV